MQFYGFCALLLRLSAIFLFAIIKKRLTSKSSQNEEAALEIYNLKISIESYEGKLKASKSAHAEQLTSFQEEIKGKEELIQELQSIIKGKIFEP